MKEVDTSCCTKETHDNLKKLLATVEICVDSEMKRRKMISKVIAEKNGKLPISVEKCRFCICTVI